MYVSVWGRVTDRYIMRMRQSTQEMPVSTSTSSFWKLLISFVPCTSGQVRSGHVGVWVRLGYP